MKRLASLAVAALATACVPAPAAIPFSGAIPPFEARARFVVVGDLQRTSFIEFWREQNDPEREQVVRAITAERPAFVAMTGDLVFSGGSAEEWAAFDALVAPLRDAGIPAVAAFGNHEYWSGRAGEERFYARFPHLAKKRWYVVPWGPLRLVVINTNESDLWAREKLEQKRWYERTLAELDGDPAVRGVLVIGHHPPYTNSTVTGDEEHVQRDFVPAFLAAKKTLAMMNGHVHSYERFERNGKTFVVSGGDGGPRAKLRSGASRRHVDDRFDGPELRDFNFVLMTVEADGLAAEVRGLPKGGGSWRAMDRFFLRFP